MNAPDDNLIDLVLCELPDGSQFVTTLKDCLANGGHIISATPPEDVQLTIERLSAADACRLAAAIAGGLLDEYGVDGSVVVIRPATADPDRTAIAGLIAD